jgi:hypothetical protein
MLSSDGTGESSSIEESFEGGVTRDLTQSAIGASHQGGPSLTEIEVRRR